MKNRIIVLLIIVFISITVAGCSNNSDSDITNESLTNNSTESTTEEIKDELIKTFDEKHNRYNFAYKRSTLSVRKEIFDEYNLTDELIQKFFDGAEIAYEKLDNFFPKYNVPDVIAYHLVPQQWGSEPDLYDDYSYASDIAGAWADPWLNAIFYYENNFPSMLSKIDAGFPAIVCHEVGHLYTMSSSEPRQFSYAPYVWNSQLIAEIAMYYLASEFTVIHPLGEILTTYEGQNLHWRKVFSLADKYGYDIISDSLKEMVPLITDTVINNRSQVDLFIEILSQKTGDDIEGYFSDLSETITIQGQYYDIASPQLFLNFANLGDSDIEPLRDMVNLTILQIGDNQITDITPLAGLTNLTTLSLQNNQVADVSTLAGLTNLTELYLGGNPITDITPLTGLTNLTTLSLDNDQISDISALANLTNLTTLILYNNQIADVSALAGLKNLKTLVLQSNPISAEQIAELREALSNTNIIADY